MTTLEKMVGESHSEKIEIKLRPKKLFYTMVKARAEEISYA